MYCFASLNIGVGWFTFSFFWQLLINIFFFVCFWLLHVLIFYWFGSTSSVGFSPTFAQLKSSLIFCLKFQSVVCSHLWLSVIIIYHKMGKEMWVLLNFGLVLRSWNVKSINQIKVVLAVSVSIMNCKHGDAQVAHTSKAESSSDNKPTVFFFWIMFHNFGRDIKC